MRRILSLRKHRWVGIVGIFLIAVLLVAGMAGCGGGGGGGGNGNGGDGENGANGNGGGGGSGTAGDPYQIADWYQLDDVRNYLDSYFILVNNLDSNTAGYTELAGPAANGGKGWQPIGSIDQSYEFVDPFTGKLDGQGYEIRDLFIDRPDDDAVGLFGAVDEGGAIENVEIVDGDVTGHRGVGILVGAGVGSVRSCSSTGYVTGLLGAGGLIGGNGGDVSDCYSAASLTGNWELGGLVGWNDGDVSDSYASGSVDGSVDGSDDVGGLVGINSGAIGNCYSTGSVTGDWNTGGLVGWNDVYGTVAESYSASNVAGSSEATGGLAGRNRGSLDSSYATGSVSGNWTVGGLVGENWAGGSISHSYATGSVSGNWTVGGLVGQNYEDGSISDSYATGSVNGDWAVGGLAGNNGASIGSCYAGGSVTGNAEVGGLVGVNYGDGSIRDSYATGRVTGGEWVGGLMGSNYGSIDNCHASGSVTGDWDVGGLAASNDGIVSDSFWDTQTSGQATSAGGAGITTAEMQDIDTFSDATWDIMAVANPSTRSRSYTWNIVDDVTYPFLSWEPVS